jgi:Pentapeptide repeats (8 copies)
VVLAVDLLWLEVPGPNAKTVRADILDYAHHGDASSKEAPLARLARVLLALPVQPTDMVLCAHAHVGCRFLTVAHRNLVPKILDATTFVALRAGADADEKHLASFEVASLRGRTLRFADLTGSELFAADLTGADLRHAVLIGTKLKKGVLSGAQLQGADLRLAQLEGASFEFAQLQGTSLDNLQL